MQSLCAGRQTPTDQSFAALLFLTLRELVNDSRASAIKLKSIE
jgi:hypothetical protein